MNNYDFSKANEEKLPLEDWLKKIVYPDKFVQYNNIFVSKKETEKLSYSESSRNFLFKAESSSYWFKHRNIVIKSGIDINPPKGGQIIDVGGGNGNTALFLKQSGYCVAMFEPGLQGALNANSRGLENVFCSMFDSNHIKHESVSSIGIFDVLEHIEHENEFLQTIYSSLSKSGKLYITVPAHKFLWSDSDVPGHFRRYNRKTLRVILENNGFKVNYDTYFFSLLPLPIFLFRTLPYSIKNILQGKQNICNSSQKIKKLKFGLIIPPLFSRIINKLLTLEINRIKKKKVIPFGASIFLSAEKNL